MIINHDDRESYRTLLRNSIRDNNHHYCNHHYCESLRTQWNKIQELGVNDDICDVVIALYHMQHTQPTSRNDDALIRNIISEPMLYRLHDDGTERTSENIRNDITNAFIGHSSKHSGRKQYIHIHDLIKAIELVSCSKPSPVFMDNHNDRTGIISRTWKYMIHKREYHLHDSGRLDAIFGYYPHDNPNMCHDLHNIQHIADGIPSNDYNRMSMVIDAAKSAYIFRYDHDGDDEDHNRKPFFITSLNSMVKNIRKGIPETLSYKGGNSIIRSILVEKTACNSVASLMRNSINGDYYTSTRHESRRIDNDAYNEHMRNMKQVQYEQFIFAILINDVFGSGDDFDKYSIIDTSTREKFEDDYTSLHHAIRNNASNGLDTEYYRKSHEIIDFIYGMYSNGMAPEFMREALKIKLS